MSTLTEEEQRLLQEMEATEKPVAAPAEAPKPKAQPKPLETFIDPDLAAQDVEIDPHDINNDMMTVTSKFAYYSKQAARANQQAARTKATIKVLEAQLYDLHRNKLVSAGEKVTEKLLEGAVHRDPRWLAGQNRLSEADAISEICKSTADAMRIKRDVVLELARNMREEMKATPRVYEKDEAQRDRVLNIVGGSA